MVSVTNPKNLRIGSVVFARNMLWKFFHMKKVLPVVKPVSVIHMNDEIPDALKELYKDFSAKFKPVDFILEAIDYGYWQYD